MRGWICKKGQVQRNEREQTKQLSLLLELSQAFSTLVDLEELLPVIIARTNNVLEAESCAVLLLDSERDEVYFPVMVDVSRERGKRFDTIRFPADRGIAGWVLKNENPSSSLTWPRIRAFMQPLINRPRHVRESCCVPHYERGLERSASFSSGIS